MTIFICYTMRGVSYDHLSFNRPSVATRWLKVLRNRGATGIKVTLG